MPDRQRAPKTKANARTSASIPLEQSLRDRIAELEARLKAVAEQQTAAAGILQVISSSPTSVQSTFEAIATAATTLCEADLSGLYLFDGDLIHFGAQAGRTLEETDAAREAFPQPLSRLSVTARAIVAAAVVQVADVSEDPEVADSLSIFRSVLSVPMLREGRPLGAITVARRVVRPFTDNQIALLQTFADQAVIAIENVRLFNETKEALDRQTATAEILRVIASSPTSLQPVLDAIATNAALVCDAYDAVVFLREGDHLRSAAHYGPITITLQHTTLSRGSVAEAAILDRHPVHVHDVLATEPSAFPLTAKAAREGGFRTVLSVPLLREDEAIGALAIRRREVQPFTPQQIDLLKTFADQAVIAIENVRLFTELEQKNRALTQAHAQVTEALEQQTATSEILRVISRSPTDVQPVFDAIASNAARLCSANDAQVLRVDGDVLRLVAAVGAPSMPPARRLTRGYLVGRAVIDRQTIHIRDLTQALAEFSESSGPQFGTRSALAVPLLREGVALGVIRISRTEIRPFTEEQIALLQTFADQAVIAIENVRLFTELQASNRELTTALDTQTATSDILRVISRSQTDVQPVFQAIVDSAVRLLNAYSGSLTRVVEDHLVLAAFSTTVETGAHVLTTTFPLSLAVEGSHTRTIRDRVPFNVADAETDPRTTERGRQIALARGYRSQVVVPMLRRDEAIGTISLTRREPGGFTTDEITLLQTFADQAVIAIENARLLNELQARTHDLTRSVEQLTALGEVGRAVSSTLDLETVLTTIVSRAVQLSRLDGGVVFEYDEADEEFVHRAATETGGGLAAARRATRVHKGEGVVGRTAITLEPAQVPDITVPGAYESSLRPNLIESGIRAVLAVPMIRDDRLVGCLVVSRNDPGDFPVETIELLRTFATQSALAIQNARLFREIEAKSRELEAASQHKSEFLANMSHELRTPLNAIIGFSEVLTERMFGDLNEKQDEYLRDIYASGQHLLSLINDILDLSKIEAGRMELEVTAFDLPTALENALTLVRERAGRRGIRLERAVDAAVGKVLADERKIKQVLLNLLSNAIKFTPEGGTIEVRAALMHDTVQVSVVDTGVGIAPEDQEAVFEEFRQVGTADKKVGGTGLGLALSRKFIELHGGRIWVTSQLGQGSTFTFTIPLRRRSSGSNADLPT